MRCSICGKQIPSGTLCEDCYRDAMEDRAASNRVIDNDNKVLVKLNRKFLPKYDILKKWELLLFFLLLFLYNVILLKIQFFVASIFLIIGLLAISLFISKRIAVGTKCLFYESKVVYKFDFLFIHIKKVIKYSDIKDIVYNQRFLQKKFGLGNIVVIPKSSGILFKGFQILDISNVEEVFKKLTNTIGSKIF